MTMPAGTGTAGLCPPHLRSGTKSPAWGPKPADTHRGACLQQPQETACPGLGVPHSHPYPCQGRPQQVHWGNTPPVTPVQLHWAKALHGSWGPWEPQCCHLPFGPQCGGLGTSLYRAGKHWDSNRGDTGLDWGSGRILGRRALGLARRSEPWVLSRVFCPVHARSYTGACASRVAEPVVALQCAGGPQPGTLAAAGKACVLAQGCPSG